MASLESLNAIVQQLTERVTVLEGQNEKLRIENSQLGGELSRLDFQDEEGEGASGEAGVDTTETEAGLLRSMLSLQEEIEASLHEENAQLREQLKAQGEVLERWAPIVLGQEMGVNATPESSSIFKHVVGEAVREFELKAATAGPPALASPPRVVAPPALMASSSSYAHTGAAASSASEPNAEHLAILRAKYAPKSPLRGHAAATSPASRWAMGAGKPVHRTDQPPHGSLFDMTGGMAGGDATLSPVQAQQPSSGKGKSRDGSAHADRPRTKRGKQRSSSKNELELEVRRILRDARSANYGPTDRGRAAPFKI